MILHLMIESKHGDSIGYMILTGFLDANKAVRVKRITIKIKGFGYGKDAVKMIVRWVFEHTETHRLWLDVKEFNLRARHIYELAGFIHEGTLRDSILNGACYESLSIMSILRHEYTG
jgi:diamine N-acetyltransferase